MLSLEEIVADVSSGLINIRVIRCTCRPGAWPCMCEREVVRERNGRRVVQVEEE